MENFLIIAGTALVVSLLWLALFEQEPDPLDTILQNDIPPDSPLEKRLLARYNDRARGIQDVYRLHEFIEVRGNHSATWQWHHLLWIIRRFGCCTEEEYTYFVTMASSCTKLTEDELLFPPPTFRID